MLAFASAMLRLDTYADTFPDDLRPVTAAIDAARRDAFEQVRESTAD
ncbi:MAG: hypothetical protein ACSLE6_05060 [Mycobacterium sp.]|jgi:hypothetical protein